MYTRGKYPCGECTGTHSSEPAMPFAPGLTELLCKYPGKERTVMNKTVLCGANAYEMKYYFNEKFNGLPESVKEELHILCVLFTEEVGGVFTVAFEEDGNVLLETNADDDDIYYDEVSSGLMVAEVRRKRQELFESLSLYYRVFILKEDVSEMLSS